MGEDFNIPVKVEVDTNEVKDKLGLVGLFLLGEALDVLFGNKGLIRPECETSFWIGTYHVTFKMQ